MSFPKKINCQWGGSFFWVEYSLTTSSDRHHGFRFPTLLLIPSTLLGRSDLPGGGDGVWQHTQVVSSMLTDRSRVSRLTSELEHVWSHIECGLLLACVRLAEVRVRDSKR